MSVAAPSMTPAADAGAPKVSGRWIVDRRYDITWFFGGAALSVLALALFFGAGVPIATLWWTWLLAFDGPHIAAAFTRTYLDRAEWRSRRSLLVGSLATFAIGPACLALGVALGSEEPFLYFLGFATLYGYYHIVRQHYGFLALYKAVGQERERFDFHLDKWALYVGCWAPYVWFLLSHPRARALARLAPEAPPHERVAMAVLLGAWALSISLPLLRATLRPDFVSRQKIAYLSLTIGLYGAFYIWIGRYEPVFQQSDGPDEDFLLLNLVNTIFHNVQYVGLVWLHNRNRYAARGEDFGPAAWVSGTQLRFLGACWSFSLVYLIIACWTNVFPSCRIFSGFHLGSVRGSQIGLSLWWGLAMNHYYLDQKIWRVRGDPVLKKNLGLA